MVVNAVPGSFPAAQDDGPADFDHTMADLTDESTTERTQETAHDSAGTSQTETVNANTSASSLQFGGSPLRTAAEKTHGRPTPEYSTKELDQHYALVQEAMGSQLDVGCMGRTTPVGWALCRLPFSQAWPNDGSRLRCPAFKEVLGQRCGQVRHGSGQHQIDCYAIDTAPDGSTQRNIVYGHSPLIVTVRKVPHPSRENDRAPTPASTSAAQNLKKEVAERDLQPKRGQKSSDDAVKLVVSRADGVQRFVGRANEATGVLPATKLRIWRVLDVQDGTYQLADLKEMGVGNQVQRFDINDETKNAKYNGKSTVETHGFSSGPNNSAQEDVWRSGPWHQAKA
ncbi:hypothetical protein LTR49_027519 [Elasticomyces elasticus]|nr:hypothetical protein LTR49_027519 [Elasticomyces elasticus]